MKLLILLSALIAREATASPIISQSRNSDTPSSRIYQRELDFGLARGDSGRIQGLGSLGRVAINEYNKGNCRFQGGRSRYC